MGLLFAFMLMGIPLAYAVWDLYQSGQLPRLQRPGTNQDNRAKASPGDESAARVAGT
jgi:hypothetical protein